MTLTPFGFGFIPLVLLVLVARPAWLPALLAISAMLHAPAVAVVGSATGITPWLLVAFAVALDLGRRIVVQRRLRLHDDPAVQPLLAAWGVFAGWGVLSAFALPIVFAGLPTYNPEHLLSLATPPEPLEWRFINLVQAVNLAILWMLLLHVAVLAAEPRLRRDLVIGLAIAGAASLTLMLMQRGVTFGWLTLEWFEHSLNPTYAQTVGYGLGRWLRLNYPFSEPSYASAWFAAWCTGGLALLLFSRRLVLGVAVLLGGALGLVNTMGGSGIAGAVAGAAVLLPVGFVVLCVRRNWKAVRARIAVLAALAGIAASAPVALQLQDRWPELKPDNVFNQIVVARLQDLPAEGGLSRTASNLHALAVVERTWGYGAGLSSNRASSWVLNLASNVGVPMTLLFFALLIVQGWLMLRVPTPAGVFVAGAQLGMFVSLAVGIPDLNWPAWWIWIVAGFALTIGSSTPSPKTGATDRGAQL